MHMVYIAEFFEATKFRNSLNVLSNVRSDGLPCPIDGFDFLLIGSIGAAYNLNTLMSCKISHILCVAESPKNMFPSDFIYKRVVMRDNPKETLSRNFNECFTFINEAKAIGGKVLILSWYITITN
jgi:hypothetical protein